ncbi:MAG: NAD(+) synthase [Patescibacteria group bacterium]
MWEAESALAGLVAWLGDQVRQAGREGVVFGMSGGLDSAVVAGLCRRCFADRARGLFLDCESDPADLADAEAAAEAVGLPLLRLDLTQVYRGLLQAAFGPDAWALPRVVTANVKSRLRMVTLYAWANKLNYLVVGTGNLDELTVGYFTKYGDSGVDLLPLGALTKGRVRELGRALGLPARVLDKPPSAGLWPGQTDERELGLSYETIDRYLLGAEVEPEAAARIERLRQASGHKRAMPPIAPLA